MACVCLPCLHIPSAARSSGDQVICCQTDSDSQCVCSVTEHAEGVSAAAAGEAGERRALAAFCGGGSGIRALPGAAAGAADACGHLRVCRDHGGALE